MITIVSGLPRAGTSLMMQMLAAGGMPILADPFRADENNPRGYFEWDQVRNIATNPQIIAQAEGKAVKLVSSFLCFLPPEHEYRIILMERPLDEVLLSMEKMHRNLHPEDEEGARAIVKPEFREALEALKREVFYWLTTRAIELKIETRRHNGVCSLPLWLRTYYHNVLAHPHYIADWIAGALSSFSQPLDIDAMVRAVDPALYRTRVKTTLPK